MALDDSLGGNEETSWADREVEKEDVEDDDDGRVGKVIDAAASISRDVRLLTFTIVLLRRRN